MRRQKPKEEIKEYRKGSSRPTLPFINFIPKVAFALAESEQWRIRGVGRTEEEDDLTRRRFEL